MDRWATLCGWAATDARAAARAFLAEATEDAAARLLGAAAWRDADVADFEGKKLAYLISGQWGLFWLASSQRKKALLPPAPRVSPRDVKALAVGVMFILGKRYEVGRIGTT